MGRPTQGLLASLSLLQVGSPAPPSGSSPTSPDVGQGHSSSSSSSSSLGTVAGRLAGESPFTRLPLAGRAFPSPLQHFRLGRGGGSVWYGLDPV